MTITPLFFDDTVLRRRIGFWFLPVFYLGTYEYTTIFWRFYFSLSGKMMAAELYVLFILGVYVLTRYAQEFAGMKEFKFTFTFNWYPIFSEVCAAIESRARSVLAYFKSRRIIRIQIVPKGVSKLIRDVRSRQYIGA